MNRYVTMMGALAWSACVGGTAERLEQEPVEASETSLSREPVEEAPAARTPVRSGDDPERVARATGSSPVAEHTAGLTGLAAGNPLTLFDGVKSGGTHSLSASRLDLGGATWNGGSGVPSRTTQRAGPT